MKFIILNRIQAENFRFAEKHIVISVRDVGAKKALLPVNPNRLAELFLEFSDINNEGKLHLTKTPKHNEHFQIVYFDKLQANLIIEFVDTWMDKVDLIVVNCEAGICRSSAIAAALSKAFFNQDNSEFFKKYLPNSLVYKTILEEYYI